MSEQRLPAIVTARDNPLIRQLRKLAHESGAYRKYGQIWVEGDHLCRAALARGVHPSVAVFAASLWEQVPQEWHAGAGKIVVIADELMSQISTLESPARMGYVLDATSVQPALEPATNTVVLDRIQDAGNVGSILRSASAMGFRQVIAIKGTAALWSPKVLRAGMGAHFGLRLHEGWQVEQVLQQLQVPLLVTHLQGGVCLHQAQLPAPCAWVLGHEGQGVQPALAQAAHSLLRIAQPGGEESLNVAAAAAICLHASATR